VRRAQPTRKVRFVSAPETLDAKELAQTNERLREQLSAVSNVLPTLSGKLKLAGSAEG
jgi:hypothetical protein